MVEQTGFWVAFFASDAWLLIAVGIILGTFDKLLDWVAAGVAHLQCAFVLDPYEEGVVIRLGKYHRTVGEGWHYILPFGIEEVMKDTVVRRTAWFGVQSVTTKCGTAINMSPIVIYRIRNIKRWELEVDDAEDAIRDITYALNQELCGETRLEDLWKPTYAEELTSRVQKEGTRWGGAVEVVKFADKSKSRSLRLWTGDGMSDGASEEGEE